MKIRLEPATASAAHIAESSRRSLLIQVEKDRETGRWQVWVKPQAHRRYACCAEYPTMLEALSEAAEWIENEVTLAIALATLDRTAHPKET